MDWFWHVLWICAVVIPVAVMWVAVVIELFRRGDISGRVRVAWLVFVLVLPLIGSVVYLATTWRRAGTGEVGPAATVGVPSRAEQPATKEVGP
jgi:hypothetical protein